jgi:hypothetical protein
VKPVVCLLLLAFFSVAGAFALEIHIAPVLYIDETENMRREEGSRVQSELLSVLHGIETGMTLQFSPLKDNRINPPVSLTDAVTVCRNEKIEYLLYGHVTRRAYHVTAEVRLFEYESRTVVQSFFGMDSPEHYGRMIGDIANKIIKDAEERFNLSIVTEKREVTRLWIPAMVGYWTPMDRDWTSKMVGTVTGGSGLIFIPSDNLWVIRGMRWYLSTGLEVKYRLGIGNPERYELYSHTVYMTMPVQLHIALSEQHEIFTGLGYTYFLDFFSFTGKYTERKTYIYNNMGLQAALGYRFAMNRTVSLFFRNNFDFLFNEHSLITYAPVIGVGIQVYEREIKKRW